MIINFTKKNIDKIIDFNQTYFNSIHNWNNDYLIFFKFRTEIDIYDINNNQIITKYKKKDCIGFFSYSLPSKDLTLGIFRYFDKIECYFI